MKSHCKTTVFHRIDHQIESPCGEQHLGCYLEGQGHSMTMQPKRDRPITLLFEVGFYNYLTEMITILRWCVTTLPIDKWNNNKMLTHKQQCSPIYKTFPITRSIIVEIQHSMWVDYWSDNFIAIDCHSKTWKHCCRGLGCSRVRHVSRIKDAIIIAKTLHFIFNYK